jgi:hypothetical protein
VIRSRSAFVFARGEEMAEEAAGEIIRREEGQK